MELKKLDNILEKDNEILLLKNFSESQDGAKFNEKKQKNNASNNASELIKSREKFIDDTSHAEKIDQLKKVSPWIPQFTPHAKDKAFDEPPKRPLSPFSGLFTTTILKQ
jgi:hypothetical protein